MSLLRQCDKCGATASNDSAEVTNKWAVVRITEVRTTRIKAEREVCGECVKPFFALMADNQ